MRVPRFQIAWIMVAVAIAALDFGAIRALLDPVWFVAGFLLLGALPMANILAVGILIGLRRPKRRPFLLGFVIFGAMALALYVALTSSFTNPDIAKNPCLGLLDSYLALNPTVEIIGPSHPFVFIPIQCFVTVVMLVWPQLAFALIGGLLSRKFKITPR